MLGQSGQDQVLHSLWGSEGTNAQSNLLLLQQPGITVSPLHVLTPQLRKDDSKNRKSKNMYLPILNSYPRIAPNLNKKPPEKLPASKEGSSEGHSLSKRVCTEKTKKEASISTQMPEEHPDKQLEKHFQSDSHSFSCSISSSNDPEEKSSCLPPPKLKTMGTSAFKSLGSSVSGSKTPSPFLPFLSSCSEPAALLLPTSKVSLSGGSIPDSTIGLTRHRRFLNTVEILSQSGLLDITLRTQELLRQSAATEQNIIQLRQHTHLLCQAAQQSSSVPTLEKIHRTMVESGCYPNLRSLLFMGSDDRGLEAHSSSRIDATIPCRYGFNGQGDVSPPSPLLTTEPVGEGRDFPSADQQNSTFGREWMRVCGKHLPQKKLLVPPDSFTSGMAAVQMYTE